MKTKFINAPPGEENKRVRNELREKGRMHLFAMLDKLTDKQTNFGNINFESLIFVLPRDGLRGYLSCTLNDWEVLRFYLSPGSTPDHYMADKVEYVYIDHDQAVSFDITGEEIVSTFYDWLRKNRKVSDIVFASQAN